MNPRSSDLGFIAVFGAMQGLGGQSNLYQGKRSPVRALS